MKAGFRSRRKSTNAKPPKLSKGSGDGVDGDESLGQEVGAQGVLSQPEWLRGCEQTEFAAALRQRIETT